MDLNLNPVVQTEAVYPGSDQWIIRAASGAFRARRERAKLFGPSLFCDPTWDLLLYLFLASDEGRGVTVSEACQAASAPSSTAQRRINHLVDRKLILRIASPKDRRSVLLYLSGLGRRQMLEFFGKLPTYAEADVAPARDHRPLAGEVGSSTN